jgi:gamma-glutamyltranspeptidase/glutathione hydrolase
MLFACRRAPEALYQFEKAAMADSAMVATSHPLAAKVGVEILKKGGNAVDAAIAVQFALAVVNPRAGNIGGGGFMILRETDGRAYSLDYREKAPAAASRDMYLDSLGQPIKDISLKGALAAGVPGTVAGLWEAYQKYSKLEDWPALLEGSIALAREGFRITQDEADRLNRFRDAFLEISGADFPFVKKEEWKAGDRLIQSELANTLERISQTGKDGFYGGPTARYIVDCMRRQNGLITREDLESYQPVWRKPVTGNYRNYRIISMPPSSSGGVALLQTLEMIEPYPIREWGAEDTRTFHLLIEAERRAYADRAQFLGDMDYYPVPLDSLLDTAYLDERFADFTPEKAMSSDSIRAGAFQVSIESFETTHTSVVDPAGNAVSLTTTVNSNYGSKLFVPGAGFFLNNEMDDFSKKPGVPNQFGLVGSDANAIEAGKRMLSSMTPTIIEKEGELFMVLGSPGGPTIITSVLQTFLNVAEFGMPIDEAIARKRFHHQWLPDQVWYEKGAMDSLTQKQLEQMGHRFVSKSALGAVKGIQVLPDGRFLGAGDPRKPDDCAKGY